MTDKKENRGGKREGAGRKTLTASEKAINRLQREMKREGRRAGELEGRTGRGKNITPEELFAKRYYDPDMPHHTWVSLAKLYVDIVFVKTVHNINENEWKKPVAYLPEIQEPPAEAQQKLDDAGHLIPEKEDMN